MIHRECRPGNSGTFGAGATAISGAPSAPRKLANFTLAAITHFAAGAPTCSQEEIDARYNTCRACELYLPDKDNPEVGTCTHKKCGCQVTRVQGFVSKLAWRDQDCPIGKWQTLT